MQGCSACICRYNLYKGLITLARAESHTGGQPSLQASVASSRGKWHNKHHHNCLQDLVYCKTALQYCATWQTVRPVGEVGSALLLWGGKKGEQTLSECGQGKQEACKRERAFPAHEARVVQGVAMLPAHTHHPPHQQPLLNLHVFFHLCAPSFFS